MAAAVTTTTAADSFPDDVVREILVHLEDAADLFRCAMTCKRWRRLVVKASFLRRRRWPDHTSTFFSGFFVREKYVLMREPATFVPTSPSVFGPHRRQLECFFPTAAAAAGDLSRNAQPLATRHGLILVCLDSPNSPDVAVRLAVCNLLVGACHELPPLRCDWNFRKSGYAILTSVDCSPNAKQEPSTPLGYSAFFKVLILGNHNLHTFTSGDTRWTGPDKIPCVSEERSGRLPLRHPRAVVWRGRAHWLVDCSTGCYASWDIIDINAETGHVSMTKIETSVVHGTAGSYDEPQLTVMAGGELSLLLMRRRGYRLEIWTLQEDGGLSRWLRASVVELKPPDDRPRLMHLIMLGEKGGMLLVKDTHGTVYTANLETGEMKMVAGFDKAVSRRQIVPFEMDWPTFFISRLGNR